MSLNANPIVYDTTLNDVVALLGENDEDYTLFTEKMFGEMDDSILVDTQLDVDPLSVKEIFNIIRNINDPEHPLTLEQLRVVQEGLITLKGNVVDVQFTPTIPHCSMATLIGLCLRVKLLRSLPRHMKVDVSITPGTHAQEDQGTLVRLITNRLLLALLE